MRVNGITSVIGVLAGFLVISPLVGAARTGQAPAAQPAGGTGTMAPGVVVTRYCVSCHSERMKSGGLVLEKVDVENVAAHPEIWERVVRKIRARAMPPAGAGRQRPDEATYSAF